jgi:hypothetical protein
MPVSRRGHPVAIVYLALVFGVTMTGLVAGFVSAPDAFVEAGFFATVVLTLPLGGLCYGMLGMLAIALGAATGGHAGVWALVAFALVSVLLFMGAAVVNAITVRGLWRWCKGRRRARHLQRGVAVAP